MKISQQKQNLFWIIALILLMLTSIFIFKNIDKPNIKDVFAEIYNWNSHTNKSISFQERSLPLTLKIPSLNINANIQYVGLRKNGEIDTPNNSYDVAWFKEGTIPGQNGNAIISGHLDTKYSSNAVFKNLNKIHLGDSIEIKNDQQKILKFSVYNIEIVDYFYKPNFILPAQTSNLVLITCAGKWMSDKKMYDKRLIVFAKLNP